MEQPQLYVFAGPNGAGKSTLSSSMLAPGTPIFDGDKEFAVLKKEFPSTDSGQLYDAINGHIFSDWKGRVKTARIDCAFETNFRSAEVMNSVKEFKDVGYETRLIFFGLDSLEASIDRVNLRVLNGGHHVSLENIKANYEFGLKNLMTFYQQFDSAHLMKSFPDANSGKKISPYLTLVQGKIMERADSVPQWVERLVNYIENIRSQNLSQNNDGPQQDPIQGRGIGR